MGIFDDKEAREKIKFIEREIQKITGNLNSLLDQQKKLKIGVEDALKRSPDFEVEAKESSKRSSEYRNKAQSTLLEINALKEKLLEFDTQITKSKANVEETEKSSNDYHERIEFLKNDIENKNEKISEELFEIQEKIKKFDEIYLTHPNLESDVEDFEQVILKIKENEAKSNQLIKGISAKKIELDTLYNEILGYTETDDEEKEYKVNGLKQDLESSFEGLNSKIENLENDYVRIEKLNIENFKLFAEEYNIKSDKILNDWDLRYVNLNKRIEALLPNALTAGLSYAFSEKKEDEVKSHEKYKSLYQKGILGLMAVSTIPFIISIISIYHQDTLDVIINRIPKIATAILPLYIPVLWFAISSSKKANLSKRLIEEYTHKEVLSKTYEGLSKQIENLENDDNAFDLKTKLLQNFLLMYSENPGKLISDYNKTDHPIMELLENSNKLETTIQKLENIPGLGKLSKLLETKSKRKLEQLTDNIEKGIDKAISLNEELDSEN